MPGAKDVRLLRRIPLFSSLPARDLALVARLARARSYRAGETIFLKSQAADGLYVVLSGRVKIFTAAGGRKKKTFSWLKRGDFFGEMALIEGESRSAAALAEEGVEVLFIAKSDFKRLLLGNPALLFYLLKIVCRRLRLANEALEDLLFRNLLGRAAKTISSLAEKGARAGGGRFLDGDYSQRELAELLGTSREPLSRALAALKRAGLVGEKNGRIFVPRPDKLAALGAP
ncbi:MAG: Crp/Fnr family transcriptional regulator [Elusimicrobia bacterium]|nr:Crp/Fnr family transcriptional regulator [Elusimicrobiota bacterium]